jgi:hypothetical protein
MAEVEERQIEEEENVPCFISVGELQKHGIQVADINKLRAGGIHTVTGVTMQTKKVFEFYFVLSVQ